MKKKFDIGTADRSTFKKPDPLPDGWRRCRGSNYLLQFRKGKKLTPTQAIVAKCYECLNCAADGAFDCEIPDCPLYGYHPYKGKRPQSGFQTDAE